MGLLHSYLPQPIFLQLGPITIYWYGFFMALAVLGGLLVSLQMAKWHKVDKEIIYDLFFYIVIAGFIGARIFYVLYNPAYFWQHPLEIFKIWQGGIAIHGALVFGILVLLSFSRKRESSEKGMSLKQWDSRLRGNDKKEAFWLLAAIIAPGLALGQAIGRWGNYFNQELFGLPTSLPWGIPIEFINRPAGFESFNYFHPAFLYESVGDIAIFILLLLMHWFFTRKARDEGRGMGDEPKLTSNGYVLRVTCYVSIVMCYALLYSTLRFGLEFLRIDPTAGNIFGVRATQGLSAMILIISIFYTIYFYYKKIPYDANDGE